MQWQGLQAKTAKIAAKLDKIDGEAEAAAFHAQAAAVRRLATTTIICVRGHHHTI